MIIQSGTTFRLFLLFLIILLGACKKGPGGEVVISPGSSRADVKAQVGEPDQTQDFQIPEELFFGPQESLANLLPAGTWVEEWVYHLEEEELYVWFAGAERQTRDQWRVIETGRYPAGAVY